VSAWLKSRQYINATGMPKSTFFRKVHDGEVEHRESKSGVREYLLETEAGDASASVCGSLLKKNLNNALAVAGVQGELPLDAQVKSPVHLTPEQQAAAKEGAKLIAAMIAFSEGRLPTVRLEDGRVIRSLWGVAEWSASQHHVDVKTVWRAWTRSEQGTNIEALARQPRKDRGRLRAFENRPELQKFVTAKWVETENISSVRKAVKREWGGPLLPYGKETTPPRWGAIDRFIDSIPPAVRDCAVLSKQEWAANNRPYITTLRGKHARVNEVWISDHRVFDVLTDNDAFFSAPPHAARRLWITVIMDLRSRVVTGWAWSISPSSRSISSALHMAISRFGKPEIFYCDNGKDYRKIAAGAKHGSLLASPVPEELDEHGRVSPSPEIRGMLARLDIKVEHCKVRNPQSKQIESFFSFVANSFDRGLFFRLGYTGSKPSLRPDFCAKHEKEHKEFLAGKRDKSPFMGAKMFMDLHGQWIKEFNEKHSHSGCGMDGKTPMAVMDELLPVAQRQIPDMLALAPCFWSVKQCMVRNSEIQMHNRLYSAALDDSSGTAEMYQANGTTIAVHLDPNDLAFGLAFENAPNGRLLARLVCKEMAAEAPVTIEHVKANEQVGAKVRKASKQVIAASIAGVPTEIELLQQRMTGTDGAGAVVRYASPERNHRRPSSSGFANDKVKELGLIDVCKDLV
jgi:transposase InsO family protein